MFEGLIWAVPVLVLAAGLWRPRAAIVTLVAAFPLFGSPPGGPYLAALDVAAIIAIVLGSRAGRGTPHRLDGAVLAMVVVSLASLLPLAYHPPSWSPGSLLRLALVFHDVQTWTLLFTWRALANLLLGAGLYVATRRSFSQSSPRPLAWALVVGLSYTLALGLAEKIGFVDLGGFRAIGRVWHTRLHSIFFHSGWLAEYIVIALPVALAVTVVRRSARQVLAIALVGMAVLTLPLTQARGSWVAVMVELGLLGVLVASDLRSDRGRLLRIGAALAVVATLAGLVVVLNPAFFSPVTQRVKRAGLDLSGRPYLWLAATEMMTERPVLGWGLGSFAPVYDLSYPRGTRFAATTRSTPHSFYFSLGAERGLLGLLAFALIGYHCLAALRRAHTRLDNEDQALTIGLTVSFGGFLVYGLIQYLFFIKMIEWLFWILLGAVAVLDPIPGRIRVDRLAKGLVIACLVAVPIRLALFETPTSAGDRTFGFHEREPRGSEWMRWSNRHAARQVTGPGSTIVIPFANGHPKAGSRPVEVVVRLDGVIQPKVVITGGWVEHRFTAPPSAGDTIVVEIAVSPVFRPFNDYRKYADLGPSEDIRTLGVAVGEIRREP